MGYRGYGLPVTDLISEGNVGIMQAVKKFDPERGFRLATYAMWWIRAQIQEYVLHSWSLVKIGTTAAQKKLFFNLRKIKNQLTSIDSGNLSPENVREIATRLDVKEGEVIEIDRANNRAKVKEINMVKKHVKTTKEKKGGIISKESFINLSNLKLIDEKVLKKTEAKK